VKNKWKKMDNNGLVRKFFEENSGRVFAYLMKMAGNRDDAEDCFQECFIKYTEKYPDTLSMPLLYTVAKSVYIDSFRKNSRYEYSEIDQASTAETPEEKILSCDIQKSLQKAMDNLSTEDRDLISMAGPQGLKYSEIAQLTGLSVANVKVKIHRIRQRLRELMGGMADGK